MRRLKRFTQSVLDDDEVLYETTADRWSRWAKHQLSKSELKNAYGKKNTALEQDMKTNKIEEGVLGAVQAMPVINRIMQLAGLEHSGAMVAETAVLSEDDAGGMLDRLVDQAQNMPQYKGNQEAARFYVIGSILSVIAQDLAARPPQTSVGQQKMQSFSLLGPLGADLMKTADDLSKAQTTTAAPAPATAPVSGAI